MGAEAAVAGHYGRGRLEQTILEAVAKSGRDPSQLTAGDLTPVDQFHVGGVQATEDLAGRMKVYSGMHLLDVGCGIGGAARYFAGRGCRVTGIDLTPEFVETAAALSRRVGLAGVLEFRQASAAGMPFESAAFDGGYMIHVGMNLADKVSVFREVRRVLKSGAVFAIFDFMQSAPGPLAYPVPWAMSEETSFVETAEAYRAALKAAGFRVEHDRSRRQFAVEFTDRAMARMAQEGPPVLGVHLLMGEQAPLMLRNVQEMTRGGRIDPVEMVARAA